MRATIAKTNIRLQRQSIRNTNGGCGRHRPHRGLKVKSHIHCMLAQELCKNIEGDPATPGSAATTCWTSTHSIPSTTAPARFQSGRPTRTRSKTTTKIPICVIRRRSINSGRVRLMNSMTGMATNTKTHMMRFSGCTHGPNSIASAQGNIAMSDGESTPASSKPTMTAVAKCHRKS